MRPTEPLVSEEAGAPPGPPGIDPIPPEEGPPQSRLSSRKILILALAVILLVVFSGWLTERRLTTNQDTTAGQLSAQPIGEAAPDFRLKSTDGREIQLSDYHGRTVIVAFWASWCLPCMVEMPELVSFYNLQGGRVPLLAVSMDDTAGAAKDYADHNHLPFPVLFDAKEQVAASYAVEGIPALFVVDADGTVRAHHQGLISSLDTVLAADVQGTHGPARVAQ